MTAVATRRLQVNGLRMSVTESGQGPLVLLCHGFPELACSWRHQVQALAAAGIPMREVDGLLTAGMWGVPGPGQLATVTLSEYLGIVPRFVDGTNIGAQAALGESNPGSGGHHVGERRIG